MASTLAALKVKTREPPIAFRRRPLRGTARLPGPFLQQGAGAIVRSRSGNAGHRSGWSLLKCALTHWSGDQAATTGAALAFYCAFSLAPLLIIVVTIAGWIIGAEAAHGYLGVQLQSLFGRATAEVLLQAMRNSQQHGGSIAAVISIVSLILGATTVFAALETALNQIWDTSASVRHGVAGWVRTRLLSLGAILAVGFLLLVSLTITTALSGLRKIVAERFAAAVVLMGGADFVAMTVLVTGLIALIYRYMPAKRLPWRPILWGALTTALLFQAGRWAIGLYLGRSTQPSAFGAAASFVALLLWLYYSAQIFLFGAELTACMGGARKSDTSRSDAPLHRAEPIPANRRRHASP
jgi:membrane protein